MPFAKHSALLLNQTNPTFNTLQTGSAYAVATSNLDPIEDAVHHFGVAFSVTAADGSSPTVDARLEGSFDKSRWFTVETMTQLVGAGSRHEHKDLGATKSLPPYVRAVIVPGGSGAPNTTAVVRLTSPGRFTLTVQAQ